MVTIVKHEWHQHDRQYAIEIDEELLSAIYPDLDEDEIAQKLADIESGEVDYEDVFNDASDNDVEIDWEFQYDDCWTDRKGGYDVTYELGDESSWVVEPEPAPHTHKCTNCKWTGQSYNAEWSWVDKEGTEIDNPRKVCPYCESDTELTEAGVIAEKESAERTARWAKEAADAEEAVPCFSCGAMHKESELPEIKESGYYCPDCNEGWVMMDSREEEPVDEVELEEALEELKREFEELTAVADDSLKESYPEDIYTIRVWGRTREIGVHKIKKAQYDYWSDEEHEDDLSDALNSGLTFMADSGNRYMQGEGQHITYNFAFDAMVTRETGRVELIHLKELDLPQSNLIICIILQMLKYC